MSELQHTQLLEQPREVNVGEIEHELTQLWKSTDNPTPGIPSAVVRSCTLNLIVVTRDPDRSSALADLVGDVTSEHPSRIFLIVADPSSAVPSIEAWISARCALPVPGEQRVCCEQISLAAKGADVSRVSSVVTSLLVPDIPIVLLWMTRVTGNDPLLDDLLHIADRALIDSSEDHIPLPALRAWNTRLQEKSRHAAFGDLAWTHITPWRSNLAQNFQNPRSRGSLFTLNNVAVEYSSSTQPMHSGFSQALLLVSWLAFSLAWDATVPMNAAETGECSCNFRRKNPDGTATEIPIMLRRVDPPNGMPGGIERITLQSADGFSLTLTMSPDRRGVGVRLVRADASKEELLTPVRYQQEAELIARELEVVYNDDLYESCLALLSGWFSPGQKV